MFSFLSTFRRNFFAQKTDQAVKFKHMHSADHSFPYHLFGVLKHVFHSAVPVLIPILPVLLICSIVKSPPDFFLSEEQRFINFTEDVFRQELSGNTLNLHYTIADPSAYGIDGSSISLGNADISSRKAACAMAENYFSTLKTFQRDKLSARHQLTYDIFYRYLKTELSSSDLILYDEPLSPTLGIQAQLPILLAEYCFRTKGDIENYLCLMTQIPDYFDSILRFEREKSAAGLFMSADCARAVIQQCQKFIADAENNYLITIFNEKIDGISNLTADEKIACKARNQSILQGYVLPAYQNLIDVINELSDTGTNDSGLYYLPQGQEYYRYLLRSKVGDEREIAEIEEEIKQQMVEDYTAVQDLLIEYGNQGNSAGSDTGSDSAQSSITCFSSAQGAITNSVPYYSPAHGSITYSDSAQSSDSPVGILNTLRQKITNDFPLLPNVSCSVKYVHKSLQEYLSPAFYLTPAIDDYENNVIYINPSSNYSGIDLFTTLAHEGYPGHLYQSVYFQASSPDLLRTILDVGGYTEGWATYVEMYSYSLWEDDPTLAAIAKHNRAFTLGLASLLDIGIHYHGYSLAEVTVFLQKLGFESETANSLYQSILQSPANYLQYYVGYLNFKRLLETEQEKWQENFSLKEFHRTILDAGPMPFALLEAQFQ